MKRIFSRKALLWLVGILAVLALIAWWLIRGDVADYSVDDTSGPKPVLVDPNPQTIPTVKVAEVVGWKEGEAPTPAQEDLAVNRFAAGLDHPRSMLLLPNGDVLVAETNSPPRKNPGVEGKVMRWLMARAGAGTPSANRISLLRDANQDGVAEEKHVLLTGLNSPFGMALKGDQLLVANTNSVMSFPFTPGQTKIDAKGEKLFDLPATGTNNHWTRGLILNPEQTLLYISVGSASNIGEQGIDVEKNRAAILEYDFEKKRLGRFATGLRNPVGMDWNPNSGELWTVVNERDMLGSDLVPDYLTNVPYGAQYGWPWIYWKKNIDDRVKAPMPNFLMEYTRKPEYGLGAHTAPLGLAFARPGSAMGADWAEGAFVARHGSWNRNPASGYDVVFVPFDDRGSPLVERDKEGIIKPGSPPIPILTGFLNDAGKARGRPAMLAWDKTGSLLVTDDVSGIIWRVSNRRELSNPGAPAAR